MASFDLNAVSGINAASKGLATISNNLANAQTTGFKSSRAEFADLFTGSQNSPGNGVRVASFTQNFGQGTIAGTGRDLDFAIDGKGFFILDDKADKYPAIFTRNGSFKVDAGGYITDQDGNQLQGFLLNSAASTEATPVFETLLSSINLESLNRLPKSTDEMSYNLNLDGQAKLNVDTNNHGVADPNATGRANLLRLIDFQDGNNALRDPFSGNPEFTVPKEVFDSLGGEHRLTASFFKRDVVSETNSTQDYNGDGINDKYSSWIVQYSMQTHNKETNSFDTSGHVANNAGQLVNAAGATVTIPAPAGTNRLEGQIFELRFNTDGVLVDVLRPNSLHSPTGQDTANSELSPLDWTSTGRSATLNWVIDTPFSGANDPLGNSRAGAVNIAVDFSKMTQFAGENSSRGVSQNGFRIGDLVGLNTGLDGVIEARYSNGRSVALAQIGLANFSDKNSLEKLGGQRFAESFGSGAVQIGSPQGSGFGLINSGSLESSNVDTTAELVHMIQTQRTFQASAQVISTSQQLFQRILNL